MAYLPLAGSDDAALSLVKVQAARIPRQTHEIEHPSGPILLVLHQAFVGHIEQYLRGQHLTPMSHQAVILPVEMSQVVQIVGVGKRGPEILEIDGQTRVDGVALDMDDADAG